MGREIGVGIFSPWVFERVRRDHKRDTCGLGGLDGWWGRRGRDKGLVEERER